ncbi:MAG: formate dehydrogenase [Burkholderiales bacterium]
MSDTRSSNAQQHAASKSPSLDTRRRRFLFALGAGSAGAAAAAVPMAQAVPAAPTAATPTDGYRETDHVRDYYATTRL